MSQNNNNAEEVFTRWQASEEELLRNVVGAVTEDSQVGRIKEKDTFWQRVHNEFNRRNFQKRGKERIMGKWRMMTRNQ